MKLINIINQKFNRWTVIDFAPAKNGQTLWLCKCDCGMVRAVNALALRKNKSKSCGCYLSEAISNKNRKHGLCNSAEYRSWGGMKNRCYNHNNPKYARYGARGIIVCDRWLESFENFLADMGSKPTPSHSIERINNDGDYEPLNCKWATKKEQANNTKNISEAKYYFYKASKNRWVTYSKDLTGKRIWKSYLTEEDARQATQNNSHPAIEISDARTSLPNEYVYPTSKKEMQHYIKTAGK